MWSELLSAESHREGGNESRLWASLREGSWGQGQGLAGASVNPTGTPKRWADEAPGEEWECGLCLCDEGQIWNPGKWGLGARLQQK